jgi:hypothetical protein
MDAEPFGMFGTVVVPDGGNGTSSNGTRPEAIGLVQPIFSWVGHCTVVWIVTTVPGAPLTGFAVLGTGTGVPVDGTADEGADHAKDAASAVATANSLIAGTLLIRTRRGGARDAGASVAR